MASRLLNPSLFHLPLRRTILVGTACLSTTFIFTPLILHQTVRPLRLDSSPVHLSPKDWSYSQYQNEAKVPLANKSGGINPRAIRQFSAGSIIGLVAGLGLSLLSKPLTILIGLLIVGTQTAQSYLGINVLPYKRLQRYVTSIDLRSAVQDNVAFKISFGLMFALSAFAELPN